MYIKSLYSYRVFLRHCKYVYITRETFCTHNLFMYIESEYTYVTGENVCT